MLTEKETKVLKFFVETGMDCNGTDNAEDLKNDNMTWASPCDIQQGLGEQRLHFTKQAIGGILASLSSKGLVQDSGESGRDSFNTDWYATDDGIDYYFEKLEWFDRMRVYS